MIIEHVWDQSFEGLTNIVDVYVRHLRAKVDDPFPVKLIRTVRGVGYGMSESETAVNTRSLSFRLIAWYACVLTLVFLLLGAPHLRRCCSSTSRRTCSMPRRAAHARSPAP